MAPNAPSNVPGAPLPGWPLERSPFHAGEKGAERLVRFRVTEGTWIENGVPLRWFEPRPASQLGNTGSWEEAGLR